MGQNPLPVLLKARGADPSLAGRVIEGSVFGLLGEIAAGNAAAGVRTVFQMDLSVLEIMAGVNQQMDHTQFIKLVETVSVLLQDVKHDATVVLTGEPSTAGHLYGSPVHCSVDASADQRGQSFSKQLRVRHYWYMVQHLEELRAAINAVTDGKATVFLQSTGCFENDHVDVCRWYPVVRDSIQPLLQEMSDRTSPAGSSSSNSSSAGGGDGGSRSDSSEVRQQLQATRDECRAAKKAMVVDICNDRDHINHGCGNRDVVVLLMGGPRKDYKGSSVVFVGPCLQACGFSGHLHALLGMSAVVNDYTMSGRSPVTAAGYMQWVDDIATVSKNFSFVQLVEVCKRHIDNALDIRAVLFSLGQLIVVPPTLRCKELQGYLLSQHVSCQQVLADYGLAGLAYGSMSLEGLSASQVQDLLDWKWMLDPQGDGKVYPVSKGQTAGALPITPSQECLSPKVRAMAAGGPPELVKALHALHMLDTVPLPAIDIVGVVDPLHSSRWPQPSLEAVVSMWNKHLGTASAGHIHMQRIPAVTAEQPWGAASQKIHYAASKPELLDKLELQRRSIFLDHLDDVGLRIKTKFHNTKAAAVVLRDLVPDEKESKRVRQWMDGQGPQFSTAIKLEDVLARLFGTLVHFQAPSRAVLVVQSESQVESARWYTDSWWLAASQDAADKLLEQQKMAYGADANQQRQRREALGQQVQAKWEQGIDGIKCIPTRGMKQLFRQVRAYCRDPTVNAIHTLLELRTEQLLPSGIVLFLHAGKCMLAANQQHADAFLAKQPQNSAAVMLPVEHGVEAVIDQYMQAQLAEAGVSGGRVRTRGNRRSNPVPHGVERTMAAAAGADVVGVPVLRNPAAAAAAAVVDVPHAPVARKRTANVAGAAAAPAVAAAEATAVEADTQGEAETGRGKRRRRPTAKWSEGMLMCKGG